MYDNRIIMHCMHESIDNTIASMAVDPTQCKTTSRQAKPRSNGSVSVKLRIKIVLDSCITADPQFSKSCMFLLILKHNVTPLITCEYPLHVTGAVIPFESHMCHISRCV